MSFRTAFRMVEGFSFYRVTTDTIDTAACTHCSPRAKARPLPAMAGRLNVSALAPGCFSCGRSLNVCPVDALEHAKSGKNRIDAKK